MEQHDATQTFDDRLIHDRAQAVKSASFFEAPLSAPETPPTAINPNHLR
jgi:hypothetical protein